MQPVDKFREAKCIDPRLRQAALVLVAGIAAALSWQLGYRRTVRTYVQDRQHMAVLTERIAALEALVRSAGGETAWLERNQRRLSMLRAKFSPQTQMPQLLNALADALKSSEVKLLDMTQGTVEPVQEGGAPVLIQGAPCYRLPVTVTAEGRYHAVLTVAERLTSEQFLGVVRVERFELHVKDPGAARLEATLTLSLYVVGQTIDHRPKT